MQVDVGCRRMTMIPVQTLITILSAVLGFALFTALVLLMYRLITRERKLAEAEKKTLSHYQEIIDKANKQAADILEKATDLSENVITQAKATNENISSDLDRMLA